MKRARPIEARIIGRDAAKRVKRLDSDQLRSYAPTTLTYLGAVLDQYLYHQGPLADVTIGLDAINAIVTELEAREGQVGASIKVA